VAALASGAAVAGAAGCGGSHPRPAALRLERADLVLLAHTLQRVQAPAGSEVAAARAVWPALAGGLPRGTSPTMQLRLSAAERRAAALTLPAFVTTEGSLTGPAAKLGGMLRAYVRLTQRGWQYTAAATAVAPGARGGRAAPVGRSEARRGTSGPGRGRTAASGTPTGAGGRSGGATTSAARFLRSNAALYIYCIYDGHYDLSLIGKALRDAYHTLGGAPAFGGSLTQAQVEALAGAYSIPSTRLTPHPPPSLTV
jgi:hypothetical protein